MVVGVVVDVGGGWEYCGMAGGYGAFREHDHTAAALSYQVGDKESWPQRVAGSRLAGYPLCF